MTFGTGNYRGTVPRLFRGDEMSEPVWDHLVKLVRSKRAVALRQHECSCGMVFVAPVVFTPTKNLGPIHGEDHVNCPKCQRTAMFSSCWYVVALDGGEAFFNQ